MPEKDVKGLILMGGRSLRMGKDKAFVQYKGLSLLKKAINNLSEVCKEVYLSVNQEQYKILHEQYACIQDNYPDKGPMGGILTALEAVNSDLLVTAVDMPELTTLTLSSLLGNGASVRAYRHQEKYWEPLPSYWPKTIEGSLKSHFSHNQLSLNGFLDKHGEAAELLADTQVFKNLNHSSDLI